MKRAKQAKAADAPKTTVAFTGVISEAKMDQHGEWKLTFRVPQSESEAIKQLGEHTEKALRIVVVPPDRDMVFGARVETE